MTAVSRFAPSTTGQAHPGTLLSALLVWLDIRSRGGRVLLRLEDLDHTRCTDTNSAGLQEALAWLGLDWDGVVLQRDRSAQHEAALDQLASSGRLYPCTCARSDRSGGRRAPDGGWAYANTCRARPLPEGGWREVRDHVRVRLDEDAVQLVDEGGLDLSQCPATEMGDPIVRRRDGVIAYHLAVVVDDADAGVNRIIRGRDIAASTATHVLLQRLLALPIPTYRHHLLLLEPRTDGPQVKLAKLHGSIPFDQLRAHMSGKDLVGSLAHAIGLTASSAPCSPAELLPSFTWSRVPSRDLVARWDNGLRLEA